MKSLWIHFLAVIIALTAVAIERPVVSNGFDSISPSLSTLPTWDADSLKNDSKVNSEKTLQIAQAFFPIVLLAHSISFETKFRHYLPLYDLHRQKEYFLLI